MMSASSVGPTTTIMREASSQVQEEVTARTLMYCSVQWFALLSYASVAQVQAEVDKQFRPEDALTCYLSKCLVSALLNVFQNSQTTAEEFQKERSHRRGFCGASCNDDRQISGGTDYNDDEQAFRGADYNDDEQSSLHEQKELTVKALMYSLSLQ
jgi:hypothetical protein